MENCILSLYFDWVKEPEPIHSNRSWLQGLIKRHFTCMKIFSALSSVQFKSRDFFLFSQFLTDSLTQQQREMSSSENSNSLDSRNFAFPHIVCFLIFVRNSREFPNKNNNADSIISHFIKREYWKFIFKNANSLNLIRCWPQKWFFCRH